MTNFKVGQKVVCVDDSGFTLTPNTPIKGRTYKIRGFYRNVLSNNVSIYLEEIVNGKIFYGTEPSFDQYRFRSIQYESVSIKLASEFIEVEEKSDVEIKELENA